MQFDKWMLKRGLSTSTAAKYAGAINGVLSSWAQDEGLLLGPLTALVDPEKFAALSAQVQQLGVFKVRDETGNRMYSNALKKFGEYLSEGYQGDIESDLDEILTDKTLSETEKSALVKSRIGQGGFRQKLIAYWSACAVTGFRDQRLLVASHIKPWSKSTNEERLDVYNGLLLSPNLDKAFDAGFITFEIDGTLRLSPLFEEPERFGITDRISVKLIPPHFPYIKHHNEFVFKER